MSFGTFLSAVFGWIYFFAWSLSFWPQTILNFRRKSVQGLSLDFVYLNVLGFACYLAWNFALFYSPSVRREYQDRNQGKYPAVQPNDVAFSLHAFILASFTLFQSILYRKNHSQKVSITAATLLAALTIGLLISIFVAIGHAITWLDVLYYCSYVKLVVSFAKYVPQMLLNYKRKSTVGWSIYNILFDFTGGVFSLAQLLLDAGLDDNWRAVTGNPGKLFLALLTLGFDIIFMLQHYVFYRGSRSEGLIFAQDVENRLDTSDDTINERTPLNT